MQLRIACVEIDDNDRTWDPRRLSSDEMQEAAAALGVDLADYKRSLQAKQGTEKSNGNRKVRNDDGDAASSTHFAPLEVPTELRKRWLLQLAVKDTGCGISEVDLPDIVSARARVCS